MEITRRNVQRNYKRNHDIVALGGVGSVRGGITNLPPLHFLPATQNEDGTYTVDVSRVNFNGSVIAREEITAYSIGSSKPEGGGSEGGGSTKPDDGGSGGGSTGTNDYNDLLNKPALNGETLTSLSKIKTINNQTLLGEGNINIEIQGGVGETKIADNLTTTDPTYALSANQGYILNGYINYKADINHTHAKSDIIDLDTKAYDDHIANNSIHVTETDKTNWNNKLDKSIWDKAFYFDEQDNLRVKQNLIGVGEITAFGIGTPGGGSEGGSGGIASFNYNDLYNKPSLNGVELTNTSKLKTINGQSLLGEGDLIISGGSGGSGGSGEISTNNYNDLSHKPKLNGIILNETSELKTINGQSLLGRGDIIITGGSDSGGSDSGGSDSGGSDSGGSGIITTNNYNDLRNKPTINGFLMIGDVKVRSIGGKRLVGYIGNDDLPVKTINGHSIFGDEDIKIEGTTNYNDLTNKPKLNGHTLEGDLRLNTINGQDIIGNSNIVIETGVGKVFKSNEYDPANNPIGYQDDEYVGGEIFNMYKVIDDRKWNKAYGQYSHAEGSYTVATNYAAHAEGFRSDALGRYSHAEGIDNSTFADATHAEGSKNKTHSYYSHAEGQENDAYGVGSHVEGYHNIARGDYSHAEGRRNVTNNRYEHAEGVCNFSTPGKTISSIGIGVDVKDIDLMEYGINPLNAVEVWNDGKVFINGINGYYGSNANDDNCIQNAFIAKQDYNALSNIPTLNYEPIKGNISLKSINGHSLIGQGNIVIQGSGSADTVTIYDGLDSANANDALSANMGRVLNEKLDTVISNGGPGVGQNYPLDPVDYPGEINYLPNRIDKAGEIFNCLSSYNFDKSRYPYPIVKNKARGIFSHAEGFSNQATEDAAHVEGGLNECDSFCGHAEGYRNVVDCSGRAGHIEGVFNTLKGIASHVEGKMNESLYHSAHAEGSNTIANSHSSHTEGICTVTTNPAEHAQGKGNKSSVRTISSIGIGKVTYKGNLPNVDYDPGFDKRIFEGEFSIKENERLNAVEVWDDGQVFIKDINDYDGTNPADGRSLQSIIYYLKNVIVKQNERLNILEIKAGTKVEIEKGSLMLETDNPELSKGLKIEDSGDLTLTTNDVNLSQAMSIDQNGDLIYEIK